MIVKVLLEIVRPVIFVAAFLTACKDSNLASQVSDDNVSVSKNQIEEASCNFDNIQILDRGIKVQDENTYAAIVKLSTVGDLLSECDVEASEAASAIEFLIERIKQSEIQSKDIAVVKFHASEGSKLYQLVIDALIRNSVGNDNAVQVTEYEVQKIIYQDEAFLDWVASTCDTLSQYKFKCENPNRLYIMAAYRPEAFGKTIEEASMSTQNLLQSDIVISVYLSQPTF